MDVFKLNKSGSNPSYLPDLDRVVDGYRSMIWAERFFTPGEFVLTTKQVKETMDLLPEGALVTHRETREVMMVETRNVKLDEKGWPVLEVKGRSLTSFPGENRHVEGKYQKKRRMRKNYSNAEAAAVLLWNAVANGSGKDVTRLGDTVISVKDQVPNLSIANSVPHVSGTRKPKRLTEGPLGPQLQTFLDKDDLGLRVVRPPSTSKIMSVLVQIDNRGDISGPTNTPNVQNLVLEVYKGVDRSKSSTEVPEDKKMLWRWDQGHIDTPEYLWSIQNFKTSIEIMSSIGGADVFRDGHTGSTGFSRRVGSFDGGSPEYPDEPTHPGKNASAQQKDNYETKMDEWRAEKAAINAEFEADLQDEATKELRRSRRVSLFSGVITEDMPHKYKRDYDLGDRVTLIGEYGMTEDMIVAEYVRTDDDEGDRGFPGLVVP